MNGDKGFWAAWHLTMPVCLLRIRKELAIVDPNGTARQRRLAVPPSPHSGAGHPITARSRDRCDDRRRYKPTPPTGGSVI